jgi:hypothetical protein
MIKRLNCLKKGVVCFSLISLLWLFISKRDLIKKCEKLWRFKTYNDTTALLADEQMIQNKAEAQFFKNNNYFHPTKAKILVSPWSLCLNEQGKDLDMLVYVFNRVNDFHQRKAIRQTYANRTLCPTANFVFVLGKSVKPAVNLQIVKENAEHGDIIQGDFIDVYRNLTF